MNAKKAENISNLMYNLYSFEHMFLSISAFSGFSEY